MKSLRVVLRANKIARNPGHAGEINISQGTVPSRGECNAAVVFTTSSGGNCRGLNIVLSSGGGGGKGIFFSTSRLVMKEVSKAVRTLQIEFVDRYC